MGFFIRQRSRTNERVSSSGFQVPSSSSEAEEVMRKANSKIHSTNDARNSEPELETRNSKPETVVSSSLCNSGESRHPSERDLSFRRKSVSHLHL